MENLLLRSAKLQSENLSLDEQSDKAFIKGSQMGSTIMNFVLVVP